MSFDETAARLQLVVSDEAATACRVLERRGLSFCAHFGTDNAVEILGHMDRAFDGGFLYEWMRERFGL